MRACLSVCMCVCLPVLIFFVCLCIGLFLFCRFFVAFSCVCVLSFMTRLFTWPSILLLFLLLLCIFIYHSYIHEAICSVVSIILFKANEGKGVKMAVPFFFFFPVHSSLSLPFSQTISPRLKGTCSFFRCGRSPTPHLNTD